jgi:hypothetical protein
MKQSEYPCGPLAMGDGGLRLGPLQAQVWLNTSQTTPTPVLRLISASMLCWQIDSGTSAVLHPHDPKRCALMRIALMNVVIIWT